MINLITQFSKNPVYLKDKIIQDRVNKKKKLHIPSWIGYLLILLFPFIIPVLFKNPKYDLYKYYLNIYFIISCYIQILYFSYKAILNSFSLVVKEKEQRTYESIINTTLTSSEILKGKFWTAFYPLFSELTLLLPLFLLTGLITGISLIKLILIYLLTLSLIIPLILAGLWSSTKATNSQHAHSWSSGILGILILGTYILGLIFRIIVSIGYKFPIDEWTYVAAISWSPLILNPFFQLSAILFHNELLPSLLQFYYQSLQSSPTINQSLCFIIAGITIMFGIYFTGALYFWKITIKNLSFIPEE